MIVTSTLIGLPVLNCQDDGNGGLVSSRDEYSTLFSGTGFFYKQKNMAFRKPSCVEIQVSVCALAFTFLSGCASGNYKNADAAGESVHKAAGQIKAENEAIDVAVARLNELVNNPAPDLKPQFKSYSASVDRLDAAAKRAEKAAEEAKLKSAEYFRNWDKEAATINFEAIRDQSVSRKTQVSNEFNTVNERYRENQAVIEPLISYLRDIRTALSTDLTAGGLQSVKPAADNAEQNARKVQMALDRLTDDMSASTTQVSSVIPRETRPEGGVSEVPETGGDRAQSTR